MVVTYRTDRMIKYAFMMNSSIQHIHPVLFHPLISTVRHVSLEEPQRIHEYKLDGRFRSLRVSALIIAIITVMTLPHRIIRHATVGYEGSASDQGILDNNKVCTLIGMFITDQCI